MSGVLCAISNDFGGEGGCENDAPIQIWESYKVRKNPQGRRRAPCRLHCKLSWVPHEQALTWIPQARHIAPSPPHAVIQYYIWWKHDGNQFWETLNLQFQTLVHLRIFIYIYVYIYVRLRIFPYMHMTLIRDATSGYRIVLIFTEFTFVYRLPNVKKDNIYI